MGGGKITITIKIKLDRTPVRLRLGTKPGARKTGGVELFGDRFGNHERNLVRRVTYGPHTDDVHPVAQGREGQAYTAVFINTEPEKRGTHPVQVKVYARST